LSVLVDSAFFSEITLAESPWQMIAKLSVHTALILGYMLAAWKLIRK
jgi:hypothetical protein